MLEYTPVASITASSMTRAPQIPTTAMKRIHRAMLPTVSSSSFDRGMRDSGSVTRDLRKCRRPVTLCWVLWSRQYSGAWRSLTTGVRAIHNVAKQFEDAVNSKNIDAAAALYAPDAVVLPKGAASITT